MMSLLERLRVTPEQMEILNQLKRERSRQFRRRMALDNFDRLEQEMDEATEERLAELPYSEFLNTSYWRILRDFVILAASERCERCSRPQITGLRTLEVHHRCYLHRGREWRYREDLEVLCRACHRQEHA
jgi:5-methylcytosine-specific restriction endonuclease McrA